MGHFSPREKYSNMMEFTTNFSFGLGSHVCVQQLEKHGSLSYGSASKGLVLITGRLTIANPRRACAARVTVVVLCVCLSVYPRLFSDYRLQGGL